MRTANIMNFKPAQHFFWLFTIPCQVGSEKEQLQGGEDTHTQAKKTRVKVHPEIYPLCPLKIYTHTRHIQMNHFKIF